MQKGYTAVELILALIVLPIGLAIAGGWIANIVKLAHMSCGLCSMEILRIVGIFLAPLGAIMGFL